MPHNTAIKYFCVEFCILFLLLRVLNEVKAEKCSCGTSKYDKSQKQVIAGKPVDDLKKYPFIVTLHRKNGSLPWGFCGGALISEKFVLTAAHCLFSSSKDVSPDCIEKHKHKCFENPRNIEIGLLGENKKKPAKKVKVHSLIIHPRYSKVKSYNDIALIKLKKPVECSSYTQTICISKEDFVKPKSKVTVAGFGRHKQNKEAGVSEVLREGTVQSTQSKYCNPDRNKRLFCTVGVTQSSCEGDSGSVVFTRRKDRYYAIGVTSTHSSFPSCSPISPVTFSKISSYMRFITKHVGKLKES